MKKSYYQNLGIYDSYKKITGNVHSFTEYELQKILLHLVKNHKNSRNHYSMENGAENN